ncbi:hypothetical protein QTP88_004738 [Uroleucon formosanum]
MLFKDLKYLRKENAKLNKKILTLRTSMSMRTEQLKQEENRHVYHTEEFNTPLLDNEEYQCCITSDYCLSFLTGFSWIFKPEPEPWLYNNGYLGASPDGLFGTNHIVEVKCPWKFRNKVLSTEIENDHSYIIYKENDHILISKQHPYWDQIQGQLLWTSMQSIITEVSNDVYQINEDDGVDHWSIFFFTFYKVTAACLSASSCLRFISSSIEPKLIL